MFRDLRGQFTDWSDMDKAPCGRDAPQLPRLTVVAPMTVDTPTEAPERPVAAADACPEGFIRGSDGRCNVWVGIERKPIDDERANYLFAKYLRAKAARSPRALLDLLRLGHADEEMP